MHVYISDQLIAGNGDGISSWQRRKPDGTGAPRMRGRNLEASTVHAGMARKFAAMCRKVRQCSAALKREGVSSAESVTRSASSGATPEPAGAAPASAGDVAFRVHAIAPTRSHGTTSRAGRGTHTFMLSTGIPHLAAAIALAGFAGIVTSIDRP